jgi:hypothetical protein
VEGDLPVLYLILSVQEVIPVVLPVPSRIFMESEEKTGQNEWFMLS